MEYIANKTGIAGLVKKAVGFIGVVAVAGGVAGCQTTGEPPKSVFVPSVAPWEAKEVERLGGCVNIGNINWLDGSVNKIAVRKNSTCERSLSGGNNINDEIAVYPKNGKISLEISNDKTSSTWKYTPNENFTGIDTYSIRIGGISRRGQVYSNTAKFIIYVGNWEYGKNFKAE